MIVIMSMNINDIFIGEVSLQDILYLEIILKC